MIYYLIATAALSGLIGSVSGVGGGLILLATLTFFIQSSQAIAIHSVSQSTSSISRCFIFRENIKWRLVRNFYFGVVPGTLIGTFLLSLLFSVNQSALLSLIAIYILVSIFFSPDVPSTKEVSNLKSFSMGFFCGIIGMFVGSTGPVVSSWLLNSGILKEEHIATKSAMQILAHLLKIFSFVFVFNFSIIDNFYVLLLMSVSAIACTFLGKKLLLYINDRIFTVAVRSLLFFIAMNILYNHL